MDTIPTPPSFSFPETTIIPTTVPSISDNRGSFFSNITTTTATTTAAAMTTTTSSSGNVIMSPDVVTGVPTTPATNMTATTTPVDLQPPQNGTEITSTQPPAVSAGPTIVEVSTTQQAPARMSTPLVIQAPAPKPTQTPVNNCPDLRDRISIDISITTTTTTSDSDVSNRNNRINNANNNHHHHNNNNNINTNAGNLPSADANKTRSDEGIGSARSLALHNMASKGSHRGIILSTADHRVGTVVQVTCVTDHHSVVLECRAGGVWNATVPSCRGGLDTSPYRLYLAVAGGAAGLVLLVLFFLYCHLLRTRKKGDKHGGNSSRTMHSRDTDGNLYVDPYHVGERLYGSPSSPHFSRTDITYAKPIVYSTYLNPSFYEDAYERWRRQEQLVSEKLYDSPWLKPRGLQMQMDTHGFKWSQTSLRNLGDSAFKKLPRAHLSMDQASAKSNASVASNRSRDQLNSQSAPVGSLETGMMRLYPSMAAHDTRASHVTPQDDVLTEDNESLSGDEQTAMDGRTNF